MNTVDIMKRLINENSMVKLECNNKKFSCKLVEDDSDYCLEILGLPEDMIIIKCDDFPETTSFFKGKNKECKRADFVLLSDSDNKMIIIELKRSKASSNNADIVAQLKGARCVMDYCEALASAFLNEESIFSKYKCYYFKYRATTTKRSFHQKQKIINNTPENASVLDGKKIYYKKLIQYV